MDIASGVGLVISGLAIVLSLVSIFRTRRQNQYQVLENYYSMDKDIKFIRARKITYGMKNLQEMKKSEEVSQIVSVFHFYGLMVKKKYLPFYIFESASGDAVIRLYEIIVPLVDERRKKNKYYAEYFEWLYEKIKKNKLKKR